MRKEVNGMERDLWFGGSTEGLRVIEESKETIIDQGETDPLLSLYTTALLFTPHSRDALNKERRGSRWGRRNKNKGGGGVKKTWISSWENWAKEDKEGRRKNWEF